MNKLDKSFFERPTLNVTQDLLGKILKMMIIEVIEEGGGELAKAKIAGDSQTFTVRP